MESYVEVEFLEILRALAPYVPVVLLFISELMGATSVTKANGLMDVVTRGLKTLTDVTTKTKQYVPAATTKPKQCVPACKHCAESSEPVIGKMEDMIRVVPVEVPKDSDAQ